MDAEDLLERDRKAALDTTLAKLLRETAENIWKRDSYAIQIAEVKAHLRKCEQEIARLKALSTEAVRDEYNEWFTQETTRITTHNELAKEPYARLSKQLAVAQEIREELKSAQPDSSLVKVFNAAIEDMMARRRIWEQQKPPKRTTPEKYRHEVISDLENDHWQLSRSLADFEENHRRHTEGAANLSLLQALLQNDPRLK